MPTVLHHIVALVAPGSRDGRNGAAEPEWPAPQAVRSSRAGTLVRVFCLTVLVAGACEVVERIALQRVSLWMAQAAGVAVLGLASTGAVYLSLRRQFDTLHRARVHAAERRRAQAENIGLTRALDQAAESVVITDTDGRIQYVNAAFSEMTGYTAEEAIGKNPRLLKSSQQAPAFYKDLWATIRTGKTWRGQLINRRKDGSLYTEEMTITPVRDAGGAIANYIAIKQDVTNRKAELEAREFLASIVESTDDAIIGRTPDGAILSWNHGAEVLYGYSAAEVLGKPVSMLVPPERRGLVQQVTDRLKRGETTCQFENVGWTKEGKTFDVLLTVSPIKNAEGQVTAGAAILRNITAHRQAEQAKALLASIVESTDDAIFSNALDGTIVSWNKGAEALYGHRASEIIGKPIAVLAAPDRLSETKQVLEQIRRGQRVSQLETVTRSRDGKPIDVSLTVSPITGETGAVVGAATIARDISFRKRVEEERASLASIVESTDDAIITRALDGTITSWNRGAEAIYGYRADEVVGKRLSPLTPPDRLDEIDEILRRIKSSERISRLETVRIRKDGTPVPVSLAICSIKNAAGELVAVAAIARDISERKRADEAIRHSEEKYRSLVANIPDVIWTADEEGRSVFVSRNCENMYGYTSEEICQSSLWFESIHPDDLPVVKEAYEALFARGQAYSVEYRMRRKDGRWIWLRDRAVNSYEREGKRYTDGIVSDISEQKRAFQLIERLQRRTELILHSAGEGILGLDPDGKFTLVNAAAARLLGFAPSELIGKEMHAVVRHSCTDGTARGECAIYASIREGTERRVTDDVFSSSTGRSFPVEYISTPKLEEGGIGGAVVVFRDIREAKAAQERIQASLKEKEALLREIHHRVKNNLQIVCSLLKLQSRGLEDSEAKRVFEGAGRRVKAMALVHETLYQSGDLAGIDFSTYASRLVAQLLHSYGLSPRNVEAQLAVESVVLPIDVAIPCALILTELVSNALKHAFAGTRTGELRIAFQRLPEASWLLEVQDSGGAEALEGPPRPGSSFGLELVRLLTEQLNGSVHIERAPGFRVTVVFPATEPIKEK